MIYFFILFVVAVIGIGVVIWLMFKDKQPSDVSIEQLSPEQLHTENNSSSTASAGGNNPKISKKESLEHFGIRKREYQEPTTTTLPKEVLQSLSDKVSNRKKAHEEHLAQKDQPSNDAINKLSNTSSAKPEQILGGQNPPTPEEIKDRANRLETMLQEKTADLEKLRTSLDNEIRHRKEFDKVKEILEKELLEVRENSRQLMTDLNKIKAEKDSLEKRGGLLEEKVTKLEKELAQKEKSSIKLETPPPVIIPEPEPEPEPIQKLTLNIPPEHTHDLTLIPPPPDSEEVGLKLPPDLTIQQPINQPDKIKE